MEGGGVLRRTDRVFLRRVERRDEEEFTRLSRASAELHAPWISAPTTAAEFETYLARFDRVVADAFVVCVAETGDMAGFANLNEIVRGHYQRASLGYGVFAHAVGQGYMTEGVGLVVAFAFKELGLHRLEADIQPGNKPSLKLVRRLGFRYEGFSPALILIRGEWKDHERWAITAGEDRHGEDWQRSRASVHKAHKVTDPYRMHGG
jgi:[ribosomal protein S5]-alanine N-acetyltransferase